MDSSRGEMRKGSLPIPRNLRFVLSSIVGLGPTWLSRSNPVHAPDPSGPFYLSGGPQPSIGLEEKLHQDHVRFCITKVLAYFN